jgi:release factor glutamine methyltransferase
MSAVAQQTSRGLIAPDMTIAQARRALAEAFEAAGLDTPALDARLLVGAALGLDHTGLTSDAFRPLDRAAVGAIETLAVRRLGREPVARILGHKEFWGLSLTVTPDTLVPRPETETVVEAALAAVDADGPRGRALRLADLGTGSGALLLALLSELPNAVGVGTDLSEGALHVARGSAMRLGLTDRARFTVCDFGTALAGEFDLLVCNPPYVASGDIASLAPEVRHDPRGALDGGPDGLDAYRAIAADARRLLAQQGRFVIELGVGQEHAVATLFSRQGLALTPARHDLSGIPRALMIRRPA